MPDEHPDAHAVTVTLEVNTIPVGTCKCRSQERAHWSIMDVEAALGRAVTPADSIRVKIVGGPTVRYDAVINP